VRAAQREPAVGHERTILVGDFYLNPFDDGMIFPSGFGEMMTKGLVRKNRGASGRIGGRLDNPIWSRLGREVEDAPRGTYYGSDIRELNIYWNYHDQVLVGADLLDHFPAERCGSASSPRSPARTGRFLSSGRPVAIGSSSSPTISRWSSTWTYHRRFLRRQSLNRS
jgi:hypothetical protein